MCIYFCVFMFGTKNLFYPSTVTVLAVLIVTNIRDLVTDFSLPCLSHELLN